jgi:hypothetical protein
MTANVKIPVASADNVTAVPLAAVFTEKASEGGLMERFVYVQQGEAFEKRNVKVGVADYFYAEIQEGLKEGEVVSLELPKEEREKKAQQPTKQKKSTAEAGGPGGKAAALISGPSTNQGAASADGGAGSEGRSKRRSPRAGSGGGSSSSSR